MTTWVVKEYTYTPKKRVKLPKGYFQLIDLKELVKLHYVATPSPGEKDFYRGVGSFEAFRNPKYPKRQSNNGHWFYPERLIEFEIDRKNIGKYLKKYYDVPEIHHESIDAFYNYIGYDRKTKRYVSVV